jgi:hypothetical protein
MKNRFIVGRMNKSITYIFVSVGGLVGGYLPVLFGANGLSILTVIGTTIGGLLGIWIAIKISRLGN